MMRAKAQEKTVEVEQPPALSDAEKITQFRQLVDKIRNSKQIGEAHKLGELPAGYEFRHELDFRNIADPQHVAEYVQ